MSLVWGCCMPYNSVRKALLAQAFSKQNDFGTRKAEVYSLMIRITAKEKVVKEPTFLLKL